MLLAGRLLSGNSPTSNRAGSAAQADSAQQTPYFTTRSLTVWASDLADWDWPQKVHAAGLNHIATHHDPEEIIAFLKTEKGQIFLHDCRQLGLEVEHWLHCYSALLPRDLFEKDPTLFRMSDKGERTPDANLCVSSKRGLEIVCENALKYANLLRPTTNRYFYAADDAKHMCFCPKCRGFSPSDQILYVANHILTALKGVDPKATMAHDAYVFTMPAPTQVKPQPGIFLEWAPITRTHARPLTDRDAQNGEHGRLLDGLYENLEVFGKEGVQVFEYWFDSYRASGWPKTRSPYHPEEKWLPAPWYPDVFHEDLAFFRSLGIRNLTSVTCWTNRRYVARFGEPPLKEYGRELLSWTEPVRQ
jgi:hypothetical protein